MLASVTFAQEVEKITDDGNNELKINLVYFVFEIVELNYERVLSDELSIGVGASYWFGEQDAIDYAINPFFRFYPLNTSRRAAMFFIEGNAAIIGGTEYYHNWLPNGNWVHDETNFVRGGAGVAAGVKLLSKNHFVAEAYLGIGRIFGSTYTEVYPRAGITFGKRF